MQFIELFVIKYTRCIKHYVTTAVVLRECYAIANGVKPCHDADKTIKSESQSCMWRRTILKSIYEETKLSHGAFGSETKNVEHFLLKLAVMNTQASTTYLNAVADKVVSFLF